MTRGERALRLGEVSRAERGACVGLNALLHSPDQSYRAAGVSRYIEQLLTWLPRVDGSLTYTAFVNRSAVRWPSWHEHVPGRATRHPAVRILWEQLALPSASRRAGLDLLHAPVNVGPLRGSCPLVVTLHDLSFYRYPELFRPGRRFYQQAMTQQTVRRAACVIAVSESTRADAIDLLGVPRDRVTVIPNGVGEEMRPLQDPEALRAFRAARGLPRQMILFLGTLEPRKNITTLLEAYALLRRQPPLDHKLVIAGGKGWYYGAIASTVERLHIEDDVLFPGYVPESDKSLWYNAADLFVYPSLYEGFGLPPLEAMACGTPAIVSNVSALPEVVGEAALLVDPRDTEALAAAMHGLLSDDERRRSLREAGLRRAQAYSWRETVTKTAALYHEVLGV